MGFLGTSRGGKQIQCEEGNTQTDEFSGWGQAAGWNREVKKQQKTADKVMKVRVTVLK